MSNHALHNRYRAPPPSQSSTSAPDPSVEICVDAAITVRMVSGDNTNTARAIARECGIVEDPESHLIPKLKVMARSSPCDKYNMVNRLRNGLEITGDGTNDAPPLREADIGLAMAIQETEVADVIVLDDNFSTIVDVAKWGRSAYINIQRFVQFQLTANVTALTINLLSVCASGSAPFTAVQLLWVNLIMHAFNTFALATDIPNDGLLQRRRNESFITRTMWRNIFGQGIYQLAVLLVLTCAGKQMLGLTGSNATALQNTFIFNAFVFCQIFNEISSRDIDKVNIFRGVIGNWMFLGLIAAIVALQVIMVQFLGAFASAVPLKWQLWLLSIVLGALSMPIALVLKYIPVNDETIAAQQDFDPLPADPELALTELIS